MPLPTFALALPAALARLDHVGSSVGGAVRGAVRWGAHHTGLPMVLVAALAVVLSWRIIKRGARLALEVVIAFAVLAVATRLGWLSW
ncbi:MAG TPA: hypothetical protein VHV30_10495 [Polyangiaceae bacterium]|jgi:hypothetical protein|nr:hypothetical protein [Polyangiaceae bacterium]